MNFYIQQSIHINFIKIGGITNSSILQIGSAGIIKGGAHLYNTGGFTKKAPMPIKPEEEDKEEEPTTSTLLEAPSVPLQAPARKWNKLFIPIEN